jgi:hypothetical protein
MTCPAAPRLAHPGDPVTEVPVAAGVVSPQRAVPSGGEDLVRGQAHGPGSSGTVSGHQGTGGPDRAGEAGVENRSPGRGRASVPVVGLGTWRRLEAAAAAGQHRELIEAAIAAGIRVIDTSPMYGAAERLLSGALDGRRGQAFIADKVWTPSAEEGAAQLSRAVDWYGGRVDLMQVHNLVAWQAHPPMNGKPPLPHPIATTQNYLLCSPLALSGFRPSKIHIGGSARDTRPEQGFRSPAWPGIMDPWTATGTASSPGASKPWATWSKDDPNPSRRCGHTPMTW